MLHIAAQPDTRLRDLAEALEVTERTAFGSWPTCPMRATW